MSIEPCGLENLVGLLDPRSFYSAESGPYTYALLILIVCEWVLIWRKKIPQLLAITTPNDANSEYRLRAGDETPHLCIDQNRIIKFKVR
jgi:hypothetical protein